MDRWKIQIHRICSDLTFDGTYWEAYNQAVKEARRYNSDVSVTSIGGSWGSIMTFSVSPTAIGAIL